MSGILSLNVLGGLVFGALGFRTFVVCPGVVSYRRSSWRVLSFSRRVVESDMVPLNQRSQYDSQDELRELRLAGQITRANVFLVFRRSVYPLFTSRYGQHGHLVNLAKILNAACEGSHAVLVSIFTTIVAGCSILKLQ
jgi:hypothetical protein